ncbi:hypothetical protein [Natronosalvus amylolyticus]|uniref:hypothetical protein n=1 Tax=Natronosalvus amylolyticus TaxID=2961994 RepID=UPI0020C9600D|nr:hypothetical protein [Natronosalvus amylolyticus]
MSDRKTIKVDSELFEELNQHRTEQGEPWDQYLWMLYRNYLYYVEESDELKTTEERIREIVREELERYD